MTIPAGKDILLLTVIITAMIALIIIVFFVSLVSYHRRYIALQKERIFAEISMQENERRRIANDLHDSLGPLVATVKLNLRMIEMEDPSMTGKLAESIKYLEEIISSLRQIAYNLLPNTLENGDLAQALTEFSERVNSQHQLGINVDVTDRPAVSKESEIHIFRILQEITHNTIKHAGAKVLEIHFKREGKDFLVTAHENGIGFDVSEARAGSQGHGLKSMDSRSEVLNGSLKIESQPGQGTSYLLRFPEQYQTA